MKKLRLRTGHLRRADYWKALEFTIEGMQVNKYSDSKLFQWIYGTYFLYMEMDHATQMYSLYEKDELIGLLMVDMKGEKKRYRTLKGRFILWAAELAMSLAVGSGANVYGEANQEMLRSYSKRTTPDGEINFLAVDRLRRGQGLGGAMIKALKNRNAGRVVFLYTDSNCIYQFYDRRGFTREETREIRMELQGKKIPLTCMLYSMRL